MFYFRFPTNDYFWHVRDYHLSVDFFYVNIFRAEFFFNVHKACKQDHS